MPDPQAPANDATRTRMDVPRPDDTLNRPPSANAVGAPTERMEAALRAFARGEAPIIVPGYDLLGELGRGGMGVVYKAMQVGLNRLVALKMILPAGQASADDLRRFRIEAEAVARLHHPNIVQIFEIGDLDGRPYFSLELCTGGNLADVVQGKAISPRDAARLIEPLARAMDHAHEAGIIHRDLKPGNILLQELATDEHGSTQTGGKNDPSDSSLRVHLCSSVANCVPKITDFGLAKRLGSEHVTLAGTVMGTPSYMAPEQASGRNHAVGVGTDVYALGAILYELLTGRPPFKGATSLHTLLQVVHSEPLAPTRLEGSVPRDLETICIKCLEKDPRKRYASAGALADDLHRFLHDEPIRARPAGHVERGWRWCRRNPVVASLIAAVVIALLAGSTASTFFGIQARRQAQRAEGKAAEAEAENLLARRHLYAAHLSLARRAWEDGQVGHLRDLLERQLPDRTGGIDLRGFEWYYWDRLCRSALFTVRGHADTLSGVAFSPDGRTLITCGGSATGEMRAWDAATGRALPVPSFNRAAVTAVAFSSDGGTVAGAGFDHRVWLWNWKTGEASSLTGHEDVVRSVAFSPDGRLLASASEDQTARLWDVTTGKELRKVEGHDLGVSAVVFSPDGARLATASLDRSARLWDVATGKEQFACRGHEGYVTSVAFSADGATLATGSLDRTVRLWNARTSQEQMVIRGHGLGISSVVFRPGASQLATACGDTVVRTWDTQTGRVLHAFKGHTGWVAAVAFSPDGQRLASAGGPDGTAKVWPPDRDQEALTLVGHTDVVTSVALSPDGNRLASGSDDRTIRLWDAGGGLPLGTLEGHGWDVSCVAFSPDGRRLASAGLDRTVRLWNAASGALQQTLEGHVDLVSSIAFSPDSAHLASCGPDETVRLWNATTGKQELSWHAHGGAVLAVAFSPDGRRLASCGEDRKVCVWEMPGGRQLGVLNGHTDAVLTVAWSPDGQHVVSGGKDRTARVWDVESGEQQLVLEGHHGAVYATAFSPDGRRIASAGGDASNALLPGELKLWDAVTGLEVLSLKGHTSRVSSLAFSPDGRHLASGSQDKTVKLWSTSPLP